jgi:hypothetical protein
MAGSIGGFNAHAANIVTAISPNLLQPPGSSAPSDGSDAADKRLARVLINDCASGVMRHADAGYELALATARKHGLKLPMLTSAAQPGAPK